MIRIIDKVKSGYYTPSSQGLVQQEEIGSIKSDGNVYLTLISQVQGTITSATLNNQAAVSITPSTLNIGRNQVVINLDGIVNGLTAGYLYVITLTVDVEGKIIAIYVNAVYQP